MVKEVRLYIEGDTKQKGNGNSITLRQGFSEFFKKWTEEENVKIAVRPVLCGDRGRAVNIFLDNSSPSPDIFPVLLIDSEREKNLEDDAKDFLKKDFPNSDFRQIKDSQCHFMVQAMESWFMADKESLAGCYDNKFNEKALPKHKEIERIPKNDAIGGLENATKETRNGRGKYGKGADSGKILGEISPQKVSAAAPHCKRLFDSILEAIA